MYFANFDSFTSAKEKSKSFAVVVDRVIGDAIQSSPIPLEALNDVVEELGDVEAGGPVHIWLGPTKSLVIIPHHQIAAVRLVFL
jgi:hypothetical protein